MLSRQNLINHERGRKDIIRSIGRIPLQHCPTSKRGGQSAESRGIKNKIFNIVACLHDTLTKVRMHRARQPEVEDLELTGVSNKKVSGF